VASYNPFAPMECDGVIHLTDSGTPGRLLHRRGPSPWTHPGTWVVTEKAYHVDDYLHYFDKVIAQRVCSAPVCQTLEKFALLQLSLRMHVEPSDLIRVPTVTATPCGTAMRSCSPRSLRCPCCQCRYARCWPIITVLKPSLHNLQLGLQRHNVYHDCL
jgi:hypothetical protein